MNNMYIILILILRTNKKRNNMKNIIKTVIVMLTSISLFTSAHAGELTVTGTAKATYNIMSGDQLGRGIGVTNEFDLGASGELDNGYTWAYQVQMDPSGAGASTNDDSKMTLTTPYGTVGFFISEGGLDLEDGASQSVYGRPTDIGGGDGVVDSFDISTYNNLQYHTPSGLLPYGIAIKLGYAPSNKGQSSSGNATGSAALASDTIANVTGYQVKAAPIDGLGLGASYLEAESANSDALQEARTVSAFVTYEIAGFSLGLSASQYQPHFSANTEALTDADDYKQANASIAYLVNDNLSVSFERESSERFLVNESHEEITSDAVQLAYTMGGMTLALSHASHNNAGYVVGADAGQTLFAVTMAF